MSLTAEEFAKREYEAMTEPNKVRVKVRVSWVGGICLPDPEGKDVEHAVFGILTFGDNHCIEKATSYDVDIKESGLLKLKIKAIDVHEYKRLMVKRSLLCWSLDIPIERDASGWMTADCYRRVSAIPAPLMDAFLTEFEKMATISDDEERIVNKQATMLFSKNSRGVTDACEAVSMFCTLGNFWEKFGWSKELLPNVPYKEYLMMKIMMGKESESVRHQANQKPGGRSKIIGKGGRPTASRGVSIPL